MRGRGDASSLRALKVGAGSAQCPSPQERL